MGNRRSRNILKSFFQLGNTPTGAQFEDFIDSVGNIADDGMARTRKDGLLLYPTTRDGRMASVYTAPEKVDQENRIPCWTFKIGEDRELLLVNEDGKVVVSVSQEEGRRRHNALPPEQPVFTSSSQPREEQGDSDYLELPADSHWHDLPIRFNVSAEVPGCRILNIIAGYRTGKKKYRVINLTATCCTGRRLKISPSQKRLFFWKSPLRLRWKKRKDGLYLQIKGKKKKHGEETLHYQAEEVWKIG